MKLTPKPNNSEVDHHYIQTGGVFDLWHTRCPTEKKKITHFFTFIFHRANIWIFRENCFAENVEGQLLSAFAWTAAWILITDTDLLSYIH